jgi:septal ring factor EnvC (AmiA/AmiB activator)
MGRVPYWRVTIFVAVLLASGAARAETPTTASRFRQLTTRTEILGDVVEQTVIPHLERHEQTLVEQGKSVSTSTQTLEAHQHFLEVQARRLTEQDRRLDDSARAMNELRTEVARQHQELETLRAVVAVRREADAAERLLVQLRSIHRARPRSPSFTPVIAQRLPAYSWPPSAGLTR